MTTETRKSGNPQEGTHGQSSRGLVSLEVLLRDLSKEMHHSRADRPYRKSRVSLVLGSDREIGKADRALEKRVGITPDHVAKLRSCLKGLGIECTVMVVEGAGYRAGFSNHDYIRSGAEVVRWEELEYLGQGPDVVHALKEPSPKETLIRPPFLRIGAVHSGDFSPTAPYLELVEKGVGIFDGSAVGSGFRVPIRGSMSKFAGRNGAERISEHLEEQGRNGRVVIVGAGYVGHSAWQKLLESKRVTGIEVFDKRADHVQRLTESPENDERVTFRACSELDDPDLVRALDGAGGLILCIAEKGKKTPKMVSLPQLDAMAPGALIIDISIDEGGAIHDPSIRHGWPHDRIISHLKQTIGQTGKEYWAVANMPRAYPGEASTAHGEAVLPYLLTLLFYAALEGGPLEALSLIQEIRPGEAPDPWTSGTHKLKALIKDLRNGLAFGSVEGRLLVEKVVASPAEILAHLIDRSIPFQATLDPKHAFSLDGVEQAKENLEKMLSLGVSGILVHHPESAADSPVSAARAVSVPVRKALKCILVEDEDGKICAALLPGDRKISERWLQSRKPLDPREALKKIGMTVKNVPVFSVIDRFRSVFVDTSVFSLGRVVVSAGHEHLSIEFEAAALSSLEIKRTRLVARQGVAKANERAILKHQQKLTKALRKNDDQIAREAVRSLNELLGPEAGSE